MSGNVRKRIFDSSDERQIIKKYQLSVPNVDVNQFHTDQSEIFPAIEIPIKDELFKSNNEQKSVLQDLQHMTINEIENFMIFFRQSHPMSQTIQQQSKINQSVNNQQYYIQLEQEGEKLRDKLKQDAKTVHTIIEKHKKLKQQKQQIIEQLNQLQVELQAYETCFRYKKFSKEITYKFKLLESKHDEIRDLYNESYNFMSVLSVAVHEKLQLSFLEQDVNESEFVSVTMQLYSEIELHSKELEQTLSEQRRLETISSTNQQFKQICQTLLEQIQQFPKYEQIKQQHMLNVQKAASQYFKHFCQEIQKYIQQYQQIISDYRISLTIIEKLYIYKQQIDSNEQIDIQRRQLKVIDFDNYKYFSCMRHKMFEKCLNYADQQILHQKLVFRQQQEYQNYQDQFEQISQNNLHEQIETLINMLNHQLSTMNFQQLIVCYKQFCKQQIQIKQLILELSQKQDNKYTDLIKNLTKLQKTENQFHNLNGLLKIQDIDQQIEFNRLEKEFINVSQFYDLTIQQMNQMLQIQLSDLDTDQVNQKKIDSNKKFNQLQQFKQQLNKLNFRKIVGDHEYMQYKIQGYLQYGKDIDCILEQVQYLNSNNIQSIYEDFNELDPRSSSSLQQLEEVIRESNKKLKLISSPQLESTKKQQVRGFEWIYGCFQKLNIFRKALIELLSNKAEIQVSQSQSGQQTRPIPLQQFQNLMINYPYGDFYFMINQGPKTQIWEKIQIELIQILLKIYKVCMRKLFNQIDILEDENIIMHLDNEKLERILRLIHQEHFKSEISKGVLLFQVMKKLGNSSQNLDQQFQLNLEQLMPKLNEMKSQIKQTKTAELQFILNYIQDQDNDNEIYTRLQEQWVTQKIFEHNISFLDDLRKQQGVFQQHLLSKSEILDNILQTHKQELIQFSNQPNDFGQQNHNNFL